MEIPSHLLKEALFKFDTKIINSCGEKCFEV